MNRLKKWFIEALRVCPKYCPDCESDKIWTADGGYSAFDWCKDCGWNNAGFRKSHMKGR